MESGYCWRLGISHFACFRCGVEVQRSGGRGFGETPATREYQNGGGRHLEEFDLIITNKVVIFISVVSLASVVVLCRPYRVYFQVFK